MDSRNITIGVLTITAVILLVGVLTLNVRPEPALAAGMAAQGGDYVLTVGRVTTNDELLYAIDSSANKLVVYRFDGNRRQIEPVQTINLKEMQDAAAGQSSGTPPGAKPVQPARPPARPTPGRGPAKP
ncbi:MAG TPA: hypothetical protein PKK06_02595 [Phycisphaerae bacterium]|nr:hypothetical protein [Phycisphaerae bacterium]HNU44574.1 hypothetical protein [Phycisphaerae bacterium]